MELFDREWTAHVEQCIKRWQEDLSHDALHINRPMTTTEIGEVTKKLKSGKSASPENIPNEIIKNGRQAIVKLLTNMFNDMYMTEAVPRAWLYGHITPLYKGKGSKEELKNHRGITVSSNIEKHLKE